MSFRRLLPNDARRAYPKPERRAAFAADHLELRMFAVDDGECVLLRFPSNRVWIIDCGSRTGEPTNQFLGQSIAQYLVDNGLLLEAIVPSHPHMDHAGGYRHLLAANPPTAPDGLTLFRSEDAAWHADKVWLRHFWPAIPAGTPDVALRNQHREVVIDPETTVHLFAGSGDGPYTSLFVQIRFREARILFTGDAHCDYETDLLDNYGETDFRADVWKVTHHGSSSGTAAQALAAGQPGIAIASTAEDGGHRLEADTLERLMADYAGPASPHGNPRRIFETLVDGDIILRTDGREYRGGVLYEQQFVSPGLFGPALGALVHPLDEVDAARTVSPHAECD